MNEFSLNKYKTFLSEDMERNRSLIGTAADNVDIDWNTGIGTVRDRVAIEKAFETAGLVEPAYLADSFSALISDGFAIPKAVRGRPGQRPETDFPIPWRALSHVGTLTAMTKANWEAIGVSPRSSADVVSAKIRESFDSVPSYLLEKERIQSLIAWANRSARLKPMGMPGPGGGGGPDDTLPPNPKKKPPIIDPKVLEDIAKFVKEAGECFLHGQWSIDLLEVGRQGTIFHFRVPIGVRVCLDRPCADKLEALLLGQGSAQIGTIITTAIATGAASSVLASAGGWIGLAFLHFAVHWGAMIAVAKGPNGVCLTHFFPWWIPIFGGIINGYGVPRP